MENREFVLGQQTDYAYEYAPSRLYRIERALGRSKIKRLCEFTGFDLWRMYEITYLDARGLPKVCMGTMKVPASSTYIVESKSFKLYLMSLTMTRFLSLLDLQNVLERDMSALLETQVEVKLTEVTAAKDFKFDSPDGFCLDTISLTVDLRPKDYEYDPKILCFDENSSKSTTASYYSHLFRSLCPVTGQPDYATLSIKYKGRKLSESSLLLYLVSLRQHQGFHEQCVELIYSDIKNMLSPDELCVSACFTRRGGIDINPLRSTSERFMTKNFRTIRQ